MGTINVYYSPTQTNKTIIGKIKGMPISKKFDFIPLSDCAKTRFTELKKINKERSVFFWGDGYKHHESYYFTKWTKIKLKANIDHHSDDIPVHHGQVTYYNHIYQTQLDMISVITPKIDIAEERFEDEIKENGKIILQVIKNFEQISEKYENGSTAITIDFDGIFGMPVVPAWLYESSIDAQMLFEFVKKYREKIGFLDMGGLNENIPDFNLLEFNEIKNSQSKYEDAIITSRICRRIERKKIEFLEENEIFASNKHLEVFDETEPKPFKALKSLTEIYDDEQIKKIIINAMQRSISYSVWTYAKILEAFAEN